MYLSCISVRTQGSTFGAGVWGGRGCKVCKTQSLGDKQLKRSFAWLLHKHTSCPFVPGADTINCRQRRRTSAGHGKEGRRREIEAQQRPWSDRQCHGSRILVVRDWDGKTLEKWTGAYVVPDVPPSVKVHDANVAAGCMRKHWFWVQRQSGSGKHRGDPRRQGGLAPTNRAGRLGSRRRRVWCRCAARNRRDDNKEVGARWTRTRYVAQMTQDANELNAICLEIGVLQSLHLESVVFAHRRATGQCGRDRKLGRALGLARGIESSCRQPPAGNVEAGCKLVEAWAKLATALLRRGLSQVCRGGLSKGAGGRCVWHARNLRSVCLLVNTDSGEQEMVHNG